MAIFYRFQIWGAMLHLRAERCVRCFRLRIYVFSSVQNQEYNNWKNVGSSWKRLSIVYSTLRHCGIYGSERGREILNKFVELMMHICLSCPSLRMQSKDLWRPCMFRHALREIDLDWCCWKIAVHMCIPYVLAQQMIVCSVSLYWFCCAIVCSWYFILPISEW